MKKFVKAMIREGSFPPEVTTDKHGETQGWYIWRPSNKRTHEGPNVSQIVLFALTFGLFSKELWILEWRARWAFSPRHLHYGRALPMSVGCILSCWLLLVLETYCGDCREKVPEKSFHHWVASFVYFSVYDGIIWTFCEYISLKFSIICLIQQENRVMILFYRLQEFVP